MTSIYSKKILLIEDDQMLANLLVQKLTLEGFGAYFARDGKSGLEAIKSIHPDMILLDLMLPEINGYQLMEILRKDSDPSIANIPIIIISNSGQPVEIDKALQYGIKDYFVKSSFDPGQVVQKIKKHMTDVDAPQPLSPSTLQKIKITIIEDDKFLRDLEAQKLAKEQIEVTTAMDGEQGIKLVEQVKPDILLLDILLPGIDGFEVLKRIRENPEIANTTVIMLSNFGQREDIQRATALGAVKFLIKANYTLDEIVSEVEEVIKNKGK